MSTVIRIESPGDRRVGIPTEFATVVIDHIDCREMVRDNLLIAFQEIFDNVDVRVIFEDCHLQMTKGAKCGVTS